MCVTIRTCAPVSVAISSMMLAFRSLWAYETPSDNTRRPSASVLLISTVRPEYNVWISSGLDEGHANVYFGWHNIVIFTHVVAVLIVVDT